PTKQRRARPKGERISRHDPLHAHDGERGQAHHKGVERVLLTDEPTIKQREPRYHQHHERGTDEHPSGVASRNGRRHDATSTCACRARACTTSAVTGVNAAVSDSPVRMRITRSRSWTKILPSPTSPVRAADTMARIVGSTNGSETAASIFTFSRNSSTSAEPRYCSMISRSPPCPLTRESVMPVTPTRNSASLTSLSRSGRIN